jgi:hypothetical protein
VLPLNNAKILLIVHKKSANSEVRAHTNIGGQLKMTRYRVALRTRRLQPYRWTNARSFVGPPAIVTRNRDSIIYKAVLLVNYSATFVDCLCRVPMRGNVTTGGACCIPPERLTKDKTVRRSHHVVGPRGLARIELERNKSILGYFQLCACT